MNTKIIFIIVYFLSFVFILHPQTTKSQLFEKHTDYSFDLSVNDTLLPQNVRDIILTDINNDTYEDIICITDQAGDIRSQDFSLLIIFENKGDGTFFEGKVVYCGSIYSDISFGKINNDEYFDLILYGDILSILFNDGSGNFEISNVPQRLEGLSLAVSMLNDDELDDIAVTSWSNDIDFVTLFNNGFGAFDTIREFDIESGEENWVPIYIDCIDLNNDNISDVSIIFTMINDLASAIYGYINNGNGNITFTSKTEYNFGIEYATIAYSDINKDGNIDALFRKFRSYPEISSGLVVALGNGNGTFSNEIIIPIKFLDIETSDINGDGYEEAIITFLDSLTILENDFKDNNNLKIGERHAIKIPPIKGSAAKIVCGDIDNDGDNDIVISNYNSYYGGITVYENSLISTDVKIESERPTEYQLLDNYPNPFNPSTTIKYILPKESSVYLRIYDIMGREIKTFIINSQPAGVSEIKWDGTNNNCIKVSSGVYIYKIKLQGLKDLDIYEKSAKLILSK